MIELWQLLVALLVGLSGVAAAIVTTVLNHRANKESGRRAEDAASRAERRAVDDERRERKISAYGDYLTAHARVTKFGIPDQPDLATLLHDTNHRAQLVASRAVRARLQSLPGGGDEALLGSVGDLRSGLVSLMVVDIESTYPPGAP
ncbi:hypothetical protein [Occultella kanbiaonis]|uniref:hypothetical protein n=1 Tax=Occultella kanbiaonis TaxID=2675754 RepID=UPI0012B8F56E|nr:hypothetical protein [Occultella kanbiaonis]